MPHNSYFIKRNLILNLIAHLGPISRTMLIDLTDFRPASISAIIKDLMDERLIVEAGFCSVGHGRKRAMLEINKSHLCAIGISFSGRSVSYLVAQIDGTILDESTTPMEDEMSKEVLVRCITDHISQLLEQFRNKQMIGIGISDPLYDPSGYVSEHSLLTNYAHFNDWVHLQLKPKLEALSGLQVETYSGVQLPAMAEQRFGVAKGAQNFICVELSNGIGSSICCNGMAVAGAKGVAGEMGHMVVEFDSGSQKLCYCGKPGCVETTTAYPALVAELQAALDRGVFSSLKTYLDEDGKITTKAIRQALDEGDRMCMYCVRQVARRLGVVIANAVNLLNPELVVLYGFMIELGDYFLNQLEINIRENVLSVSSDFEIKTSASMETIMPLGAVAEIFASYLHSADYRWVYQLQPSDLDEYAMTTADE